MARSVDCETSHLLNVGCRRSCRARVQLHRLSTAVMGIVSVALRYFYGLLTYHLVSVQNQVQLSMVLRCIRHVDVATRSDFIQL